MTTFLRRLAVGLLLGAFAMTTMSATAQPASPPTLEDVLNTLGIDKAPADYVVVVDTSGTMQESGLYPRVKEALAPFLSALRPVDHLSLLTFDTAATIRFTDVVKNDPKRALDQLPQNAEGVATDIGAGIAAGLAELERPGAYEVGALVLITDGKHQPSEKSAYPTTAGQTWDTLAVRARQVSEQHRIVSYALALAPTTDAELLKGTFPQTVVLAIPSDQVDGVLGRVTQQLRLDAARRAIEPDLKGIIEASWDGQLSSIDLNSGSARVNLTLRSRLTAVPVTVSHLVAQVSGADIMIGGLRDSVELAPGQTVHLSAQLYPAHAGGFGFGTKRVTETGRLTLSGDVSSPWQPVLEHDLGLSFKPSLQSQPADLTATLTKGWSYLRLVLTFLLPPLGLIALAILAWLMYQRSKPILRGALVATATGGLPVRGILAGRNVAIGTIKGSQLNISGRGRVTGKRVARRGRRKGFDLELQIQYASSPNAKAERGRCKPNASTVVDGVTFTYQPNTKS